MPDPTDAFRRVLAEVLDNQPQEIAVLDERLKSRFPVLNGGAYCQQVTERMTHDTRWSLDVMAPAVAHGLRRLEIAGVIVLSNLADAPRRMSMPDDSDAGRTVSHVALAPTQSGTRG